MRHAVLAGLFCGLSASWAVAAGPKTDAPGPKPERPYDRMVHAYMEGDWDALDKELRLAARQSSALTTAQKADVAYLRQARAECRPAWWNQCKAGRKGPIQASVWGRTLNAIYDPAGKGGVQLQTAGAQQILTLSWNPADMDNPAPAEYGFTKGDLANLGAWQNLGMARVWTTLPMQVLFAQAEPQKLRLQRCLDYWGNVTGLYYAGPPARRWALHIFLAAFMEKYGKGPIAGSRRVVASMFLVEVLTAPEKYPSLKLPDKLPADSAEEKLAVHYKFKIGRKNHWTVAEDRSFRQAVAAFVKANERTVFETGKVRLPNGLVCALDAAEDAVLKPNRDAWLKAQFDKAAGGR